MVIALRVPRIHGTLKLEGSEVPQGLSSSGSGPYHVGSWRVWESTYTKKRWLNYSHALASILPRQLSRTSTSEEEALKAACLEAASILFAKY